MADSKISELTSLMGTQLASLDMFAVVDLSTTTTKRITAGELIGGIVSLATTTQIAALTSTQIDALGVQASQVGFSTVGAVTDNADVQGVLDHALSTGLLDGGDLTDNGATVDIAACDFLVRQGTLEDSPLATYRIAAATGIALTANDVNWIYLDYNSGSPQWAVTTSLAGFNGIDKVVAYVIGRNTSAPAHNHILNLRNVGVDAGRKVRRTMIETDGFIFNGFWRSSLATSTLTSSGLDILVGAGKYFFFNTEITHSAFDTSGASTFEQWYNRTGTWTRVPAQGAINATQYDNAGTLTTMDNNKWRTDWVYVVPDSGDEHLVVITGNAQYTSQSAAQAAPMPSSLPPQIAELCILVGQITVQKSAASMTALSAGSTTFNGAASTSHNNLSGLDGGAVGEYYHLTSAQHAALSSALTVTTIAALSMSGIY